MLPAGWGQEVCERVAAAASSDRTLTGDDAVRDGDGEADPAAEAVRVRRLGRAHRALVLGIPAAQHDHLHQDRANPSSAGGCLTLCTLPLDRKLLCTC